MQQVPSAVSIFVKQKVQSYGVHICQTKATKIRCQYLSNKSYKATVSIFVKQKL